MSSSENQASAAPEHLANGVKDMSVNSKPDKKAKGGSAGGMPLEFEPRPAFFQARIDMFERIKAEQDSARAAAERKPITITMPDGSTREGLSWETSPMDIARAISKSLSERIVISKVNGQLWDLERPLEGDATLELLDFDLSLIHI